MNLNNMKKTNIKWIKNPVIGSNNNIYNGNGYYLSYNPCIGMCVINDLLVVLTGASNNEEEAETAFFDETSGKWIVLNGDHIKAINTTSEVKVKQIFKKLQKKYESGYSTIEL